jgi:hypothetical protein
VSLPIDNLKNLLRQFSGKLVVFVIRVVDLRRSVMKERIQELASKLIEALGLADQPRLQPIPVRSRERERLAEEQRRRARRR